MGSLIHSRPDSLSNLLSIAARVNEQAKGKEVKQVLIRSFSESECLVDKQKSNIVVRFFDALFSLIKRKKIIPYDLKQNLIFLNQILQNCDLETVAPDENRHTIATLITTVHTIVDAHLAHLSQDVKSILQSIDSQKNRLEKRERVIRPLQLLEKPVEAKDTSKDFQQPCTYAESGFAVTGKELDKHTISDLPLVEKPVEIKDNNKDFIKLCKYAERGFSVTGKELDERIIEVGQFQNSDLDSDMKKVIGLFAIALQLYRKIERTKAQADYGSYEAIQGLQKKYASLLASIERQQISVAALYEKNPDQADALFRAYNTLVNSIGYELESCEQHERPLRIAAYLNNNFTHFDTITNNINKATSFVQLNLLLHLLRQEDALIRQSLPEKSLKEIQPKIEQAVIQLIERTIALSKSTREKMLESAKFASSNWEVIKGEALVQGYEETLLSLKEWPPKVRETQRKALEAELRQGDLAISQARTILRPKMQHTVDKVEKDITTQIDKGTTIQHTGPVNAQSGTVAAGVLVARDITINNCTDTQKKFLQQMTDQVRAAKSAGLIQFNDILELAQVSVPQQAESMFKVVDLIGLAYFVPTVVQMLYSGSSLPSALAFAGLGASIPFLVRKFAPKDLQQPLTGALLVNYYSLGPAAWRIGERHIINLTQSLSSAPAAENAAVAANKPATPANVSHPEPVAKSLAFRDKEESAATTNTTVAPANFSHPEPAAKSLAFHDDLGITKIKEKQTVGLSVISPPDNKEFLPLVQEPPVAKAAFKPQPTTPANATLTQEQGFTYATFNPQNVDPTVVPSKPALPKKPAIAPLPKQELGFTNATFNPQNVEPTVVPISSTTPIPEESGSSGLKNLAQGVYDLGKRGTQSIAQRVYDLWKREPKPLQGNWPEEEDLVRAQLKEYDEEPTLSIIFDGVADTMGFVADKVGIAASKVNELIQTSSQIEPQAQEVAHSGAPVTQSALFRSPSPTPKQEQGFSNATFKPQNVEPISILSKPTLPGESVLAPPPKQELGFSNATFKPQDIEPTVIPSTPTLPKKSILAPPPKQELGFTNATFKPQDIEPIVVPSKPALPEKPVIAPPPKQELGFTNATFKPQDVEFSRPVSEPAPLPTAQVEEATTYKRFFSWLSGNKAATKQEAASQKTNSFWADFTKGFMAAAKADQEVTSEFSKGWDAAKKLDPSGLKAPQVLETFLQSNEQPKTVSNPQDVTIQNPPQRSA